MTEYEEQYNVRVYYDRNGRGRYADTRTVMARSIREASNIVAMAARMDGLVDVETVVMERQLR